MYGNGNIWDPMGPMGFPWEWGDSDYIMEMGMGAGIKVWE